MYWGNVGCVVLYNAFNKGSPRAKSLLCVQKIAQTAPFATLLLNAPKPNTSMKMIPFEINNAAQTHQFTPVNDMVPTEWKIRQGSDTWNRKVPRPCPTEVGMRLARPIPYPRTIMLNVENIALITSSRSTDAEGVIEGDGAVILFNTSILYGRSVCRVVGCSKSINIR